MTSYTASRASWDLATMPPPASKSSASTVAAIAKVRKPSRVIRKFGRPAEKSSLDLDRTSAEQGHDVYYAASSSSYDTSFATNSLHDLTWNSSTTGGNRRKYHQRSTSGTSQFSTRTSGSYNRNGSFQHPWQQTPRPYTPPSAVCHQDAVGGEFDRPRVSFADEDIVNGRAASRAASALSTHTAGTLASPPLRVDPLLDVKPNEKLTSLSIDKEPLPNLSHNSSLPLFTTEEPTEENPTSHWNPSDLSPSVIRSSMDFAGYRLRSLSEGGGLRKTEIESFPTVEEARRRYENKERAKEEREAREALKAIEKKSLKEARKAEERTRKSTSERRKDRHSSGNEMKGSINMETMNAFYARDYGSARDDAPPVTDPSASRSRLPKIKTAKAAKRKTHTAWTTFTIWFRTRLLRMSQKL